MNKAVNGDGLERLIVAKAKILFEVTNGQFDGEASGVKLDNLSRGKSQIGGEKQDGFFDTTILTFLLRLRNQSSAQTQ